MNIYPCNNVVGAYIIRTFEDKDTFGTRKVIYSFYELNKHNVNDVFTCIYKKKFDRAYEFSGLFYKANTSIIIRFVTGKARLILVDLREDKEVKTGVSVEFDSKYHTQVYLPSGVAWGILSYEETEIMLYSTAELSEGLVLLDIMDKNLELDFLNVEFSFADVCKDAVPINTITAKMINEEKM